MSIGERVSEEMAEFSGVSNSTLNEKYHNIAQNFTIHTLSEEGIELRDFSDITDAAKNTLDAINDELSEYVSPASYTAHLSIKKLGKKKVKKNSSDTGDAEARAALHVARVLTAYNEDITLSVQSRSTQTNNVSTDFVISMNSESEEPLISMLRGVYGKAEVKELKEIEEFSNTVYASGKFIFRGKEKDKQEKEYKKYESWISSVLRSLPEDKNFTASMRFCPLKDTDFAEQTLEDMGWLYNKLKFYSELDWNNSSSFGNNINHKKNFLANKLDNLTTHDETGESHNASMTLGGKEINKEAQLLMQELEHAMTRLKLVKQTAFWAVRVAVSADEENTIQTIISLISGAAAEAGVKLEWGADEDEYFWACSEEILPLMRFPDKEFAGFEFVENEEFSLLSQSDTDEGFNIGNILWNGEPFAPFYLSPKALSRHAFICGMTGAGKSNTLFNLIESINLPFCVIEPVKGEYRALRSVYSDMKVWTMKVAGGDHDAVDVMRINPFWFPENSNLAFHIDSIKTIISSAFELTAAMPNILEQCLYNVYVNAGWDLVTNKNIYKDKLPEEYLYPTFSDLCTEIEDYLDKSDFDAEVMGNYKGALLTRIKSFINGYKGILLNTGAHPDYEEIMNGHCVIELEGLADDADKCLVMGTILVQYYQYLKLHFKDTSEKNTLRHIVVIEEAHRLFKNVKKNNNKAEGADPTGQLVESLSNMMAEIRAFGEGMLIVDQSPTKLADDVIKNSATKLIHRIDNGDDIKALQSAMLLPDDILSFASLSQGEALIRADGMTKPCKVKIFRSNVKEEYSLASSFRPGEAVNNELSGIFTATSILYNEEICAEIQKIIIAFLNCLILTDIENWYGLMRDMLYGIIRILRDYSVYDIVDYRMSVLFEIISLAIKRMGCLESKKDLGIVHMFVMRMTEFFKEEKEGGFIKPDATRLFETYLKNNIEDIMKRVCMNGCYYDEYNGLCDYIGADKNDFFMLMLGKYIGDTLPAIMDLKTNLEEDELMLRFFSNRVLILSAQAQMAEKYGDIIVKASEYLNSCVINKDEA